MQQHSVGVPMMQLMQNSVSGGSQNHPPKSSVQKVSDTPLSTHLKPLNIRTKDFPGAILSLIAIPIQTFFCHIGMKSSVNYFGFQSSQMTTNHKMSENGYLLCAKGPLASREFYMTRVSNSSPPPWPKGAVTIPHPSSPIGHYFPSRTRSTKNMQFGGQKNVKMWQKV